MAQTFGIKLRRYGVKNANQAYFACFRIKIEVIDTHNMPGEIFLYKRTPPSAYNNTYVDEFETVCSPVDLSEYPIGAPDPTRQYPFLRKSYIEVDMRAESELEAFWELIQKEVCRLVTAMETMQNLSVIEDWNCGTLPVEAGSSSVSVAIL